jgi:hypothetical protein
MVFVPTESFVTRQINCRQIVSNCKILETITIFRAAKFSNTLLHLFLRLTQLELTS